jgi:hypothetical protein
VTRRRKLISLYRGIGQTYLRRSPSLIGAAIFVFVPLGLVDALAAEVNLDALDLSSGIKIAALIAAVSAVTATSLLGEVFYSGVVAISLTHPEDEPPPSLLAIARRLNYRRLIAIDLIYVALVLVGMVALVVPGVLFFVWFGLSGPVVEIEERTVRGALGRSWELVRSNFWVVFFVLVPVELVGDSLAEWVVSLVHDWLGDSLFAGWLAESVSNILLSPLFAIAAVLLTLDLIAQKDGAGKGSVPASTPEPAAA